MDIKSIEVCTVVTVIGLIGVIINILILFQGQIDGLMNVLLIIFLVFNIFAFSSFRPIANIRGVYTGKSRYLLFRRLLGYFLWVVAGIAMLSYREKGGEISSTLAMMNLALGFSIVNAYGFGKTRGKFYWCKYV